MIQDQLAIAQERGLIGPGRLESHIHHAKTLARVLEGFSGRCCDLGSGGGLPGLILALEWSGAAVTLLDSRERSIAFLREAVRDLGLVGRVQVIQGRAEELGQSPLRESFDLVVARDFGPPAPTAECGAGLVRMGGKLIVSEPPNFVEGRWLADGYEKLGLSTPALCEDESVHYALFDKVASLDNQYPRSGAFRRPLWV